MYLLHGSSKRIWAMALAVMLLISMLPTTAFAAGHTHVSKDNADLVAENYADILSAQEMAVLQSGMLTVTQTHEYALPASDEDGLVAVDSDAKTVKVGTYTDNGYTWAVREARVVYEGGQEVIDLNDQGEGSFVYDGDLYTVEVDYVLYIHVAAAEQADLLNAPHYLATGIRNLDTIAGLKNGLSVFSTHVETLYNSLVIGYSVAMPNGTTVTMKLGEGVARDAFISLYEQWTANGGELELTQEIDRYLAASNKLTYLQENGQAMKAVLEETYGYFNAIYTDYNNTSGTIQAAIASVKNAASWGLIDASIYDTLQSAVDTALKDSLSSDLVASITEVVNDPWTILNVTWPVREAVMEDAALLAQLQLLVEAAVGYTAEHDTDALQEALLADRATVEAGISRHNVTVKVEGYYIAGIDTDALTVHSAAVSQTLKLLEGSTQEQVAAAVTIQAEGLKQLVAALPGVGFDGEGYEVVVEYDGGAALSGDATYTIKYMPKRMAVTCDFAGQLPAEVYYGYRMTLPVHENANRVYDYDVNGVFHNQGEMIVILEPTTITRVAGEPWTHVSYNKGAQELLNYALLSSNVLKTDDSEWFQIRYPKGFLVATEGNVLTAQNYASGYEGLEWVTVSGTVYRDEEAVATVPFVNGQITVDEVYDYVLVNYEVVINGHFREDRMLESLNLPYVLYQQYVEQKAAMDFLCYADDGSGEISYLLEGLSKLNSEMIDMLPGLVGYLGDEADEAIYSLRDNCFDVEKDAPYMLEYLQGYLDGGMAYYYAADNYEKMNRQMLLLQSNMDAILDDPELSNTLEVFDASQYEDQIREVADALRGIVLLAPHEDIVRDGSVLASELQAFVEALEAAANAVEYTAVPEMKLHYACRVENLEGHEHVYEAVVTEPTCTEQGYTTYTCTLCGGSYVDDYVKALGHSYSAWVELTAPTCTEPGSQKRTCYCGHEEISNIPALGHSYGDWEEIAAPTCTEAGSRKHTCQSCAYEETEEVAALGHDYREVTMEPTCTEQGYIAHVCHRCSDWYIATYLPALGHNYESTVKEPTCTEPGFTTHTCTTCGSSYIDSDVAATGHDFGDWTEVTAPTCTEKGLEKRRCHTCAHEETREIKALGHAYESVVTEATCTEQGYTTHTCTLCGHSYVDSYVAATGHAYGEWETVTPATCTEYGEEQRTCQTCGYQELRPTENLGHEYDAVVTAPTCTEQGYTTYTCTLCGHSYVDSYVAATGHTYGEWVEITAPTCTEKGSQKHTCHCGYEETAEIPALGHAYESVVTEPSCTEQGYTTHTCSRCDHSYTDAYVDAHGHAYTAEAVAPSGTDFGGTKYTCQYCGDSYSEAFADGWVQVGSNWYLYKNGTPLTGWQQLSGNWYYLNADYTMATGWLKLGTAWYYMNQSGVMQTGWEKIDGKDYYFNNSGVMQTGWLQIGDSYVWKRYYLGTDGAMRTGWLELDGNTYYLRNDGSMHYGWLELNGLWYYMGTDGVMHTGWGQFNGYWFYCDANGVQQTGWVKVDGKWYYMDEEGVMQTGLITVGGKTYYLDASGVMQTGVVKVDGKLFFFDENGARQKVAGWKMVDGKSYYFDWWNGARTGWVKISSNWYYFDGAGVMQTGWIKDGSNWYYTSPSGVMQTGWVLISGNRYYFNKSGVMQTGWIKVGSNWYYTNSSGVQQTGWVKVGSDWYYMNASGVMKTGWLKLGGNWYYLRSNGSMVANTTIRINGVKYTFNKNGVWIA